MILIYVFHVINFQALPVHLLSYDLLAEVKFVPDTEDITQTVLRLLLFTGALSGEIHHQGPLLTITLLVVEGDVLYAVHGLTLEMILYRIITLDPRVVTVTKITNSGETCQQ